MKTTRGFCSCCGSIQNVHLCPSVDTKGKKYSDLCCDECHLIIATLEGWPVLSCEEEQPCPDCGQVDRGQTGEYACPECGLPKVWDETYDCPIHGKQEGGTCPRC